VAEIAGLPLNVSQIICHFTRMGSKNRDLIELTTQIIKDGAK
jgi:hypothetical protein